ncbi:unnamed protein product [Discosporangium mesarthrocarpum]
MGLERMKEEFVLLSSDSHKAEWAQLVAGLDPHTAHVMTSLWEAAGGQEGMPGFYEAVFSSGEGDLQGRLVELREEFSAQECKRVLSEVAGV